MSRYLLPTTCDNPEYNADCDYAVVEITADDLARFERRAAILRAAGGQDDRLYEMYFWGCSADFYSLADMEEAFAVAGIPDIGEGVRLPDKIALGPYTPHRVECGQEIFRRDACADWVEIGWVVIPKHTDLYVTTRPLVLENLREEIPLADPR